MGAIRVNQMGYSPDSTKQVVYVGGEKSFQIYNADNHQLEFKGNLKHRGFNQISGENLSAGDFTAFQKQGYYYIEINHERSSAFTISNKQHEICTDALLKAFYYQRCGVELEEQHAGKWKRSACHQQPAYLFYQKAEDFINKSEMETFDTTGGWHDAGDYGRYTIATAKTIADMLIAYEHSESAFDHSINIPESELEGADILHEVRIGLDFLFKMQRKADGAVYTKVTTRCFPGIIMPEQEMEPLLIFDISSPATASFAAVMAMAAKTYQSTDHNYSKKCLTAAKQAYQWLKNNQTPNLFENPQDVLSGEYGDNCDMDERYWAAAQLYRATGEEQYHNDFLKWYVILEDKLTLGWKNVGGYGTIAYLTCQYSVNKEVQDNLKTDWLNYASELEQRSQKDGYGITLSREEYIWGSLMILLNHAFHLIFANRLLKQPRYDKVIERNWDYVFGMNPMDLSYVTCMGERSVKHPHHRPSEADGVAEPVQGFVVGGPCAALMDEIASRQCQGLPPAKCYVDDYNSFSTNEIDIYWNSPAVYVGAYLSSRWKY